MLQRLLNECVLTVELAVSGRVFVQESKEKTEKRNENLPKDERAAAVVQTRRADGAWSIYLPGASLKGALRAQAERIARTLNEQGACDPFAVLPKNGGSVPFDLACSERIVIRQRQHERLQRETPKAVELTIGDRFQDVCPICQTFGHVGWGRRLRVTDFYPVEEPVLQKVTHIGVDRVGGGVSQPYKGGGKYGSGRTYGLQYIHQARFTGEIILENYELWQLGLLGLLWEDMVEGLLPVGHKKTAGLGEVRPHLREIRLTQLTLTQPPAGVLQGVGSLTEEQEKYGYDAENDRVESVEISWIRPDGEIRWQAQSLNENAARRLWKVIKPKTTAVLGQHRWPEAMAADRILRLKEGFS